MTDKKTKPTAATAAPSPGDPIELKKGDPCPACGGALTPAAVDSATAEDQAALGALYHCAGCGYKTRFPA